MHTYTVEFRVINENGPLDLDAITNSLGITPTNTRQIGEAKSKTRAFTESMWGYSIEPEGDRVDWDNLEDALQLLVTVFQPLKGLIAELRNQYTVVIWCGHFTSSFDGGPTLSGDVLGKLGDLGVELYLDTYSCQDENASAQ